MSDKYALLREAARNKAPLKLAQQSESILALLDEQSALLEALIALRNHFDKASYDEALAMANTAIAKATGESHGE
jgi:hypothetical protein